MASSKITLFDIPSKDKGCACWSLNPWKIRLAMNYKGIDYETQWVEYPDIAPTFKSFGIPPGEDEDTPYTVPAVRFPDGSYVMNSKAIIEEIEKRYASPDYPPLYLDDPNTKRAFTFIGEFFGKLKGNLLPEVPVKVLTDVSAEYFERTRAGWFGMSLQELAKKEGGEPAWTDSKEVFQRLADALKETSGPFFLGNTVSYADFVIVSFLHFVRRLVGDEDFKRIQTWPEVVALYEACEKWLQKDT